MERIENISKAIEIFKDASVKQIEATENGDYKNGNKNFDRLEKSVIYLKENDVLEDLKKFLSSSSLGLRLWSAYYLLPVFETESIEVLEGIVKINNIHSFTAENTIQEWKKGNLTKIKEKSKKKGLLGKLGF